MTALGKALLLANLALSLIMAAIALAIFTNHIDWPGVRSSGPEASQYVRLRHEIEEAQRSAGIGQARYDEGKELVARLERQVPEDEAFYAHQLAVLTGVDAQGRPINEPIRLLSNPPRGPRTKGVPVGSAALLWSKPARPLRSIAVLNGEIAQVEKEIRETMHAVEETIQNQNQRTVELNGLENQQKGLRVLLDEERKAAQSARAELQHLQPLRYNSEVEADLLQQRQQALSARLNELRKLSMAVR